MEGKPNKDIPPRKPSVGELYLLLEIAQNLNIPKMATDLEEIIENASHKKPSRAERFKNLVLLFDVAEAVLEAKGRKEAIPLLGSIYNNLIDLNKTKGQGSPLGEWNPHGDLTKDQFEVLNRRRKKLSNDIGIMTASGVVRHNLNEI